MIQPSREGLLALFNGIVGAPDASGMITFKVHSDVVERLRSSAQSLPSSEPTAFINKRLEDLAEANALYGKDQRLGAPDKIARNDREISWLKDLRSMIALPASSGEVLDPFEGSTLGPWRVSPDSRCR